MYISFFQIYLFMNIKIKIDSFLNVFRIQTQGLLYVPHDTHRISRN